MDMDSGLINLLEQLITVIIPTLGIAAMAAIVFLLLHYKPWEASRAAKLTTVKFLLIAVIVGPFNLLLSSLIWHDNMFRQDFWLIYDQIKPALGLLWLCIFAFLAIGCFCREAEIRKEENAKRAREGIA